jgi:hypothetical protein
MRSQSPSPLTNNVIKPGMVVHSCSPSTWEVEAGGSGIRDQPGLHSKILAQNNNDDYGSRGDVINSQAQASFPTSDN